MPAPHARCQQWRIRWMRGGECGAHEKRVLKELSAKGFVPRVIYDIGASTGVWSECISRVLPAAQFHMFEPLSGAVDFYSADLQNRLGRMPNLHLHPIALGATEGTVPMFVARDGYGSSLHDRGDIPEVKERVQVPVRRLDDYVAEQRLPPPDAIKIDTQGGEEAIMSGARNALASAQVLFLETWFQRFYGPKTPLLNEIIDFLRPHGFSL